MPLLTVVLLIVGEPEVAVNSIPVVTLFISKPQVTSLAILSHRDAAPEGGGTIELKAYR